MNQLQEALALKAENEQYRLQMEEEFTKLREELEEERAALAKTKKEAEETKAKAKEILRRAQEAKSGLDQLRPISSASTDKGHSPEADPEET